MTLERRETPSGRTHLVCHACPLCGDELTEQQGLSNHLPSCPARDIFAEPHALRNGGPDPERVQAAIAFHEDQHEADADPELAADGGQEVEE